MKDYTEENNKKIIEALDNLLVKMKLKINHYPKKHLGKIIRILEKNGFTSVKDYKSVKYLMELETYFKDPSLVNLCFIDYKPYINNKVLRHAEIEILLEELKKEPELSIFILHILSLNAGHFLLGYFDHEDYRVQALYLAIQTKHTLEDNKLYKDFLLNFILFVITLGMAQPANKAINGNYFFTTKKKTLNKLNDLINSLKTIDSNDDSIKDIPTVSTLSK